MNLSVSTVPRYLDVNGRTPWNDLQRERTRPEVGTSKQGQPPAPSASRRSSQGRDEVELHRPERREPIESETTNETLLALANWTHHPLLDEVFKTGVSRAALRACLRMVADVLIAAPQVDGAVFRTEDDGAAMEFNEPTTGRDLTLVVPEDGSVRYFVARGPDRFRKAGVVLEDAAISGMARWLGDPRHAFPVGGIEVG